MFSSMSIVQRELMGIHVAPGRRGEKERALSALLDAGVLISYQLSSRTVIVHKNRDRFGSVPEEFGHPKRDPRINLTHCKVTALRRA